MFLDKIDEMKQSENIEERHGDLPLLDEEVDSFNDNLVLER